MDSGIIEEQKSDELAKETADAIIMHLEIIMAEERWVSCETYSKYYDLCPRTIRNYHKFLSRNGAVLGEGKTTRYDKFFNPKTGERTIP